ncbi:SH3 domain-containing C40 family peptidase [Oscillibacter sp.]|uniref:C40 family peptidase n=1 Tax=Oscillibacter sp. TaxID=1945593 RepID=UPI00262D2AA9|nr:SH3 domain-containing C40 family peptidase [Oscillibacter sp.]MDD3346890.1 SH3 domain-containing C40 family peptidase [Oscillibacter sp.]
MMNHFAGKAAKFLFLSALTTMLLALSALAADETQAIAVGATTGSSLRIRAVASTSSPVVTTLDKSVAVAVLDDSVAGWYEIRYAGNSGFVSSDYLVIDQDNIFESYGQVNSDGVNVRSSASTESASVASLDAGATVTVNAFTDGWYAVTCQYGTEGYIRSDFLELVSSDASSSGSSIVDSARQHLGTRYLYGGASPSGFDCSGFTMYIYQQFGYSLPHTATGQWQSGVGTQVWSIAALQPGDLVFFCDPSRSLGKACSHAGIYVGDGQFIHSSSSRSNGVIISDLTSGYYNTYFVGGIHV